MGWQREHVPILSDGEGGLYVMANAPVTWQPMMRDAISTDTAGENVIVEAVVDKRIKVINVCIVVGGSVSLRFLSGLGGEPLTGWLPLAAEGNGFVLPPAEPGYHWMETEKGEPLVLELSDAIQVSGLLVYYTYTVD